MAVFYRTAARKGKPGTLAELIGAAKEGELKLKGLAQVITFMGEDGTVKALLPPTEPFVDLQYPQAAGIK